MLPRREIRQSWLYREMHTKSIAATRAIAARYGDAFGFVYVGGYPKSGTTWISRMIADYLELPFPQDYALPLAFRCLVHHHWEHRPAFDRSFYVIRDGRDVMISEYMNLMYGVRARRERIARFGRLSSLERLLLLRAGRDARLLRRMERRFGVGFDPSDVARHLPGFLEANLTRPFSEAVPATWPRHVRAWLRKGRNTTFLRYEDMVRDGQGTLERAIASSTTTDVDREGVRRVIDRHSFRRVTGREAGEEDRTHLARKGIVGDWRNHFTPEAAEIFRRHAGDVLIELGYEPDDGWVSRVAT
jgi:hypothetical protein